ncbi:MAG: FAD-binding oxidoreductase, partial [Rhizobium sp.]
DMPEATLDAYLAQHHGWGYDIQPVNRAAIAALEPHLADPPAFAVHVAEEGAVEPVAAARLLLEDAVRHGATLTYGTKATRLLQTDGGVTGVETADGPLPADHVVLAAGAGIVPLAASAGIDVPLETPPGLIAHSRPAPRLLNGLVMAPGLHMRQTPEGRIIAGSDFGGTDPGRDPQKAAGELLAKVRSMLRDSDGLELDFHTIGYRPTPKDGFPIIGGAEGVPGLYLAVLHSGVTLAPIVGLLASEEIIGARSQAELAPFRLSRFAKAGE